MPHIEYVDAANRAATGQWGREFSSTDEAVRRLLANVDMSGACLLSLVRTLNVVIKAISEDYISSRLDSLRTLVDKAISEFVDEREKAHGPCPDEVMYHLKNQAMETIGRRLLWGNGAIPNYVGCLTIPPKGTKARAAYDKWMKRNRPNE